MRIKYNFIKISVNQPQRRFNTKSNRQKISEIILSLQPECYLYDVLKQCDWKYSLDIKTVMSVISKMKQSGYINLHESKREE